MMGAFLTRVSVMILGYAYPAYECFKTVELNKPEIEQLLFWCQYWILVAVLTVFERVGDALISWLPLYGEVKLAFFVYLWHPKTKGTTYIYNTFFRPYMSKHENVIDRNLLELRTRAADLAVLYWQKTLSNGRSWFFEIFQYVVSQPSSTKEYPVEETIHAQQHIAIASPHQSEQTLTAAQQPKTEQTNLIISQKPQDVKTCSSPRSGHVPSTTRSTPAHHPTPHDEILVTTTNDHNSFPQPEETRQEEQMRIVRRARIKKRATTTTTTTTTTADNSVH